MLVEYTVGETKQPSLVLTIRVGEWDENDLEKQVSMFVSDCSCHLDRKSGMCDSGVRGANGGYSDNEYTLETKERDRHA